MAWGLWEGKLADGYGPDDVLAAYDAYRGAYFKHNRTVKFAKRLDRWLSDADGLDAYARITEVGPYGSGGRAGALDEAARREARRRADTDTLSDALAGVDGTYREMLAEADAARTRALESRDSADWDVAGVLSDRAMGYLAAHDKRARAALFERVRAEIDRGANDEKAEVM